MFLNNSIFLCRKQFPALLFCVPASQQPFVCPSLEDWHNNLRSTTLFSITTQREWLKRMDMGSICMDNCTIYWQATKQKKSPHTHTHIHTRSNNNTTRALSFSACQQSIFAVVVIPYQKGEAESDWENLWLWQSQKKKKPTAYNWITHTHSLAYIWIKETPETYTCM